jgi:cytochrome c-type biogenesis protein CcmH/NrfF
MLSLLFVLIQSLTPQQEEAAKLMKEIWSPYCKGNSLLECPSSKAEDLREEIYARMQSGESREQVIESLKGRYGDSLTMSPGTSGREGWAHRLPWIFSALGVLLVAIFWLTRPRKRPPPQRIQIDDKMKEKILRELQDRQG